MGSVRVTFADGGEDDRQTLQKAMQQIAKDFSPQVKVALPRVGPEIAGGVGEALRASLKASMPVVPDLTAVLNSSVKSSINAQLLLRDANLNAISRVVAAQYNAERVLARQTLVNTHSVLEAVQRSLLSQADMRAMIDAANANASSFSAALKRATQAAAVPSIDEARQVADLMRSGSLDAEAWNAIADQLTEAPDVAGAIDTATERLQTDVPTLSRAQARATVVALVYIVSLFGIASLLVVTDAKWLGFLMAATGLSARDGADAAGKAFDSAYPEELDDDA